MKARYRRITILASLIAVAIWWHARMPEPTVLAFRLGQPFEQVANGSTYPVLEHSHRPADDPGENRFGATWVTEPSVIIRFTDRNADSRYRRPNSLHLPFHKTKRSRWPPRRC